MTYTIWILSSKREHLYLITCNFPEDDNLNPAINEDVDIEIIVMFRFPSFKYEHLAQLLYLK